MKNFSLSFRSRILRSILMLMLLLLRSQMTHEHALVLSNETETVQMLRCSYALVFLLWLCSNFNSNERYYAILCLCPHITNNMTIIIIKTLLLLLISYVRVTLSFSCSCPCHMSCVTLSFLCVTLSCAVTVSIFHVNVFRIRKIRR